MPSRSFFFQAEDGIRGPLVTGVQTCALPIYRCVRARYPAAAGRTGGAFPRRRLSGVKAARGADDILVAGGTGFLGSRLVERLLRRASTRVWIIARRSEERRVGKGAEAQSCAG